MRCPTGRRIYLKSKVVADYLDEAPMIWEGIVKTKYAKKTRSPHQDAGGDQAQGGAERATTRDRALEENFAGMRRSRTKARPKEALRNWRS